MSNGIRGHAHADLNLFERLLISQNNLRNNLRRRAVKAVTHNLHALEVLGHDLDKTIVIQISGRSDDHVARRKSLAIKIKYRGTVELLDRVASSKDWSAQRMIFPETLGENFVDEIVGIIFIHLDFFEDHTALAADVLDVKDRVQYEIAQNVEGDGHVLVENLDAEADAFLGGERVHVSA